MASTNGYGTFTLTAAGVVDLHARQQQRDRAGAQRRQTLTDTFTATTVDGTPQLVTITIHGTNDAAVISGTAAGSVVEAGGVANGTPGTPIAAGDLNATDVDNPNDAWSAVGFADSQRQRLWHLHFDCCRSVDLHARTTTTPPCRRSTPVRR